MTTIGFIGSGNIGSSLAEVAVAKGYDVVMSNSRGPQTLGELVSRLGPHARAATAQQAAEAGDVVVVTVPLKALDDVPVEPLAGKVVIDTNNYYPERDGRIPELEAETTTTAEMLQSRAPQARVVKAFNHIMASDIAEDAAPAGTPGRRALAIAGDDAEAKAWVAAFIDEVGFDVVDLGPLAEGWRIQRDTPGYVARFDADELRARTRDAKRYAEMG